MTVQIINCEQGTDDWFRARLGIPTASMFSAVMAKGEGKTRRSYLNQLAAEVITGEIGESFTSPAMERGKVMEDEARNFYAFMHDVEPERVGFIRNGNKGCSPDSLIGKNGALEIKTQRADLLVATIFKNEFPSEHKAQCQGVLWIAEREWIDLAVYWPKMPRFVKRATRDEAYIAELARTIDQFNTELHETIERLRLCGVEPAEKAA